MGKYIMNLVFCELLRKKDFIGKTHEFMFDKIISDTIMTTSNLSLSTRNNKKVPSSISP